LKKKKKNEKNDLRKSTIKMTNKTIKKKYV